VDFVNYIGSMLLAMLPPRYRAKRRLRGPAIASAILECFVAVSVAIGRIYAFAPRPGLVPDKLANEMFVRNGGEFIVANAVGGALNFWLDPVVLVCLYFFFESVIRVFAAIEGNQILGVLPLYSISVVHGFLDRAVHKRNLGPLVVDQIVPGGAGQGYALQIQSCRPKPDWNNYVSVEFRGEFFECFREEKGPPPRRFIYYLRKRSIGRLVVVIRKYKPDDVLNYR